MGAWTRTPGSSGLRAVLQAGVAVVVVSWVTGGVLVPGATHGTQVEIVAALVVAAIAVRLVVGSPRLRVAVAGDLADVASIVGELERDRRRHWTVAAACVSLDESAATSGAIGADLRTIPMWLGTEELVDAALASGANAVVVAPGRALDPAAVRRTCWAAHAAGLEVYVGTGLLDMVPARVQHVSAGLLGLARIRPRTGPSTTRLAKAATDRAIAALTLFALLPLMLVIAVVIRWDSPGPVLYSQRRVGRGGSTFTMFKFRTMRTDADQRRVDLAHRNDCDAVLFKLREDPRITRVGRILRRYSLDELPQLINIVRGEMSLVGPRPALPAEVAQYAPDPRHRLAVRPGLTGLWQVSGRSDLSWDESVRLDLHYVDNWSWALDLRILARTVGAVLGHRGAY
nr:sugar transferase [Nocardioides sp. MAH-18]